jgi:predicted RNA-binding protein YlxR (DUF448 family)
MARKKHQPQRTCIVCRQVKDKRDLIRLVRTPEGGIIIDPTGKANGRGAYLCKTAGCWEQGVQKGRLSRALKTTLTQETLDALKTELLKA